LSFFDAGIISLICSYYYVKRKKTIEKKGVFFNKAYKKWRYKIVSANIALKIEIVIK